jgi:hypothetical protein
MIEFIISLFAVAGNLFIRILTEGIFDSNALPSLGMKNGE